VPNTPTRNLDLGQLRLDDAQALLQRVSYTALPEMSAEPTRYLQAVIDGLCQLSQRDPLTGLANRKQFEAALLRENDVVARSGRPAMLLLLTVDHFQSLQHTRSSDWVDEVIRRIAGVMSRSVRPQDMVARCGTDEFAVILTDCNAADGSMVAERLRERVEHLAMSGLDTKDLSTEDLSTQGIALTASVGAAFAPEWTRCPASAWLERADTQLYQAKARGGNLVCLDLDPLVAVSAEEKNMLFAAFGADLAAAGAHTVEDSL